MRFCTPEEAGISSASVRKFYKTLEAYHISAHSIILARGDKIFSECYYRSEERRVGKECRSRWSPDQ